MKSIIIISMLLAANSPRRFHKIWEQDYNAAMFFIQKNNSTIQEVFYGNTVAPEIIISAVFPEIVRYNSFRDFFETGSLEIAYVKYGLTAIDFSIGQFQMKPSFAAQLETDIAKNKSLCSIYPELPIDKSLDERKQRKIRIDRLKQIKWQLRYLGAFTDMVYEKFPHVEVLPTSKQVAFLAAAYNLGYKHSREAIEKWIGISSFPDGKDAWTTQFSYASIAVYFYQHHANKTFQKSIQY